ncbi:MAG TPA: alpha/beta fold hydrolase [Candidatus Hydrogenedentes bacterium]|nr:alpha/beta fold hydrolase [Candidatus Hydrogenedentota bacterium]
MPRLSVPFRSRRGLFGRILFLGTLLTLAAPVYAQWLPYRVDKGIVYHKAKGIDLVVDVFVPTFENLNPMFGSPEEGKGKGIIDVVSGGFKDSDDRLREHEMAGLFMVMCNRGYTVFAVRPGSVPQFTDLEMTANLQWGIRWVKENAPKYGVDPEKLALAGASAGGHLALMSMVNEEQGDPSAQDPLMRHGTRVKAVVAFFPPADFLRWENDQPVDYSREPKLMFSDGLEGHSREEQDAMAARLSPARHVKPGLPPLLLIHGDSDPIVPLNQSLYMEQAMREAGNEVKLIIKPGGGHFWLTIIEEIMVAADWVTQKLADGK